MVTIATHRRDRKNKFDTVAEPFLQGEGLPFSDVLDAEWIQRIFSEEDALFAQDDIFSTDIALWAFLAQTLRDGKGAACSAAVADITTYMLQTGQRPPAGDTGDYCRARAKLSLSALRRLVVESAGQLERDADESWLFKRHQADPWLGPPPLQDAAHGSSGVVGDAVGLQSDPQSDRDVRGRP